MINSRKTRWEGTCITYERNKRFIQSFVRGNTIGWTERKLEGNIKIKRSLDFLRFTRRRLAVIYRRFGTTCRSSPQGSSGPSSLLKVDSHIACSAHAVHLPCRAAKGLECIFPIWFTQCGRVWFTLAMPCPCRAMLWPCRSSQGHCAARPSRDDLWATCPRSASSGYHVEFHEVCYQKHTDLRCRWPVWNQTTFVKDEEKLIILVQGHECLYNWQHKDYDNHLVKDYCWKERAGEVHAQGKEQATQYFVHYRKAYCLYAFVWYYSDNVTALFISVEERKYCGQGSAPTDPTFQSTVGTFPYTHGFFTSTSTGTAKCCDVRELWWSICVSNHTVFHNDTIS